MSTFLNTHTLALTPLSPIHIGCGEDFEPTNYIIEDGLLYGFDPSRATLTDLQRNKLGEVARRGSLAGIQRFFRDNAATFKPHAHVVMPVAKGVASQYEKRLGEAANWEANGKPVFNQLEVERHAFTGSLQQPFIPGTSFKGALRTAWLDHLNAERLPRDVEYKHNGEAKSTARMETNLLGGDFQTSPLRLLKVADLMPVQEPEREVLFAVNRKKKQVTGRDGNTAQPKGIAARKDCVLPGQYRLFQASVTLPALLNHVGATNAKNEPITPAARQLNAQGAVDLAALARQSNAYHLRRLRRELAVLDGCGLVNPEWKRGIEALLAPQTELDHRLQSGQAFLVRLGRYGGADNKTLTGEGVASIKIMGAKGEKPTFESATKTVWLAAQYETDQKHLIPFGWAVVEVDPHADCASLKSWCLTQAQDRPSMAAKRAALQVERQAALAQKTQLAAAAAQRTAAAEAQRLAAAQRAQALRSLSQQAQQTEALRQKCEDWVNKLPPHGNFQKQDADPGRTGLYQDAVRLIKTAQEQADWTAADKAALADMIETWLPQVIDRWDPKEQRKKLKLASLCTAA